MLVGISDYSHAGVKHGVERRAECALFVGNWYIIVYRESGVGT